MRNTKWILIAISILLSLVNKSFADEGILFQSQRDFGTSKGLTFDPYVIEDY